MLLGLSTARFLFLLKERWFSRLRPSTPASQKSGDIGQHWFSRASQSNQLVPDDAAAGRQWTGRLPKRQRPREGQTRPNP
jgi:hypothetical protein